MSKLAKEIERLKKEFPAADANKVRALEALIEQATYEKLNKKASISSSTAPLLSTTW